MIFNAFCGSSCGLGDLCYKKFHESLMGLIYANIPCLTLGIEISCRVVVCERGA